MSRFTSRSVRVTDSTGPADFTPAFAVGAAATVLAAPIVGAAIIGGLTYSLLQSDNAG